MKCKSCGSNRVFYEKEYESYMCENCGAVHNHYSDGEEKYIKPKKKK